MDFQRAKTEADPEQHADDTTEGSLHRRRVRADDEDRDERCEHRAGCPAKFPSHHARPAVKAIFARVLESLRIVRKGSRWQMRFSCPMKLAATLSTPRLRCPAAPADARS
jgi:hypothetical protein